VKFTIPGSEPVAIFVIFSGKYQNLDGKGLFDNKKAPRREGLLESH